MIDHTQKKKKMEFRAEDLNTFITCSCKKLGPGTQFSGRIPADNPFGLEEEMDVIVEVSVDQKQFENQLRLRHLHHKNLVRLIGFSSSQDHFYLVYESVDGKSLSDIIKSLYWEQMLKILRGIAEGISYLHCHPMGPYVLCNICSDHILVTEDFIPKIVNFKRCVVEGEMHIGGTPGYYSNKEEGIASRKDDVLALGVLAMQLVTKDCRTIFPVQQGSEVVHLKHILDVYVPQFRDGVNLVHPSYGHRPVESRRLTEMVIRCLKKDDRIDITTFRKDVVLLSMSRQLVST